MWVTLKLWTTVESRSCGVSTILRGEGDCRGRGKATKEKAEMSPQHFFPSGVGTPFPRPLVYLGPSPSLFLCALAVGSRVSQELQYTKEKLGEEASYTSQMLIQTANQEGGNVLTPEALDLHLQAALTASKVQVSLYGK